MKKVILTLMISLAVSAVDAAESVTRKSNHGQDLNYASGTSQIIRTARNNLIGRLNVISSEMWSKVFNLTPVDRAELIGILNNIKFSPLDELVGVNPLGESDKQPLTYGIYNGKKGIQVLGLFYDMIRDNKILDRKFDPVESSEEASVGRFLLHESLHHFGYNQDDAWLTSRRAFPGSVEYFAQCNAYSEKYPGGKCILHSLERDAFRAAYSSVRDWLVDGQSQNQIAFLFEKGSWVGAEEITFPLDSPKKEVNFVIEGKKPFSIDFSAPEQIGSLKYSHPVVLQARCTNDPKENLVYCIHNTLSGSVGQLSPPRHIYKIAFSNFDISYTEMAPKAPVYLDKYYPHAIYIK